MPPLPEPSAQNPGIRVAMAFKIRDEGDVLEHNLRFHHALGVDHFIVTDNGSTDETVDILARYREAGLLTVIDAPNTDYREEGARWMTDMARLAATELGADWVVHTDADEFWWPIEGSLKEVLASIDDRYGVLIAPRCEFIGRPDGPGSFADRLTIREARARYQPKVAHRADPQVVMLDRGPHDVSAVGPSGDVAETVRPPGRPVHRVIRNRELGASSWPEEDTRLVWAPSWPVRILHFPVRSSAQFRRRTQIAIFEGMFPDRGRFRRLREHWEQGRFEELYAELIFDESEVDAGLRQGRLVLDERFARLLGRCPDPLAGGPSGTLRVEPTAEELERDRAELTFDAMHTLARTSRWLMVNRDRNRERLATAIEQRDALKARESKLRQRAGGRPLGLWSRLRRALARPRG
jgi:Glycosyl transferase family 2